MEKRGIIIYSYRKLWKHEKRVYAFQNIKLPVSASMSEVLYIVLGLLLAFLFSKIPAVAVIPWIFRWVLFPYGFMKFMETVKLDGKNPIYFLGSCIRFWFMEAGISMEHFRRYRKPEEVSLSWQTGMGVSVIKTKRTKQVRIKWDASEGRSVHV